MPEVLLLHSQCSLFCRLSDPINHFLTDYELLVKLHAGLVTVPTKDTGSGSSQVSQLCGAIARMPTTKVASKAKKARFTRPTHPCKLFGTFAIQFP